MRKNDLQRLACVWVGLLAGFTGARTALGHLPPQYDFLIVVDTSFSMAREKQAVAETVFQLLRAGIAGQARPGDQLGVWTFNERVYSTRFLPETWTPERGEIIADRVARYLRSQRFEKQTRLDTALADILKAAKASKSLTVFLVSDGDSSISGTPFDRSLNLLYKEHYRELYQARRPFVTTLVAIDGQLVSWAVATRGEAIRIPDVASSARISRAVAPIALFATNAVSLTPAPREEAKGAPETKLSTDSFKQAASDSEVKPAAAAEPGPVEKKAENQLETPKLASAPEEPRVPAVKPETGPSVAVTSSSKPSPTELPPTMETTAKKNTPLVSRPRTDEEAMPVLPGTVEKATPPPAPARAATNAAAPREVKPGALPTEPGSSLPPQQTAVVVPEVSGAHSPALLVSGVTLLLLAAGLLYWWARTPRRRRSSLISRSLDGEEK